ncbi:hypothetical protein FJT64_016765 [Amphibalanus amphitrite]|uniref:Uncharacterized protein n=1 Tax=Amphibalanus amphitrite TaxID=1232801 RepID=A0A6A4X4S4_AMPAM|nr:hypothetical protein FJT64_016765 [Amphibalanus amphitrite]
MVPAETLVGLQNLLVHLRDVSAENAHVYQYRLWDARRVKVETAQNRGVSPDGSVVVAVNACRTAPEGSAGRLLSLLDQLRLPDAGALPDWGLHPGMLLGAARRLLVIPGYAIYRVDRPDGRGYGGVAVVARDDLTVAPFKPTAQHPPDSRLETIWSLLKLDHGRQLVLCSIYRPPRYTAAALDADFGDLEAQVPAETLVGLQNLLVHLRDVSAENAHVYQYRLWDAKRVKVETAQNRGVSPDGAAGYRDGLRRATNGHPLSAEEVQKVVSRVNQLSS